MNLKLQTFILATPNEILRILLDQPNRKNWEYNASSPSYKYFYVQSKFYILEDDKVWILDQIKNRPHYIRATLFLKSASFSKEAKQFAAFQNYVQQYDRQTEIPIEI